ncbi:MAG: 3-deoxy-8-phosphooctulonate synthase [Spirochaetes bacterium GWF1_41_5]|nr:MAG: 3-deoxy-8-phosphooctulonate synthase [Spirochaetes bacterium GWF1_41_5]HBE01360.1 3-deoxy-8-phosphooctulonate synthase [Spirochaetia bacterium]
MFFPSQKLIFIGGPCVIEGQEMLEQVCSSLKDICSRLDIFFVFKSSFDKANRTGINSFRGPGLAEGVKMLLAIKKKYNVPVITDVHFPEQIAQIPAEIDVLQIPAFLCRQTDFYIEAARLGRVLNVKKGQFLSPWDMKNAIDKFQQAGGKEITLTERGSSFGYNNLIVDFRSIQVMKSFGVKYIYDATHSLQLPGGEGNASGGLREFIPGLVFAQIAAGADGLFMEVHPDIEKARCDRATQYPFDKIEGLLTDAAGLWDYTLKNLFKKKYL